jgi:hypothetical protein
LCGPTVYTNRMYNVLVLASEWHNGSLLAIAPQGWPPDSAITWFFEPEDNGNGRLFLPMAVFRTRLFLPAIR